MIGAIDSYVPLYSLIYPVNIFSARALYADVIDAVVIQRWREMVCVRRGPVTQDKMMAIFVEPKTMTPGLK